VNITNHFSFYSLISVIPVIFRFTKLTLSKKKQLQNVLSGLEWNIKSKIVYFSSDCFAY